MSALLSFYIDDKTVQAVELSIKDGIISSLGQAVIFPMEGLDAFLASSRVRNCILCCNPESFNHYIFNLPPATSSHYEQIISGELKKLHPEEASSHPCFFYGITEETAIEGVISRKLSVFSYPSDKISGYISSFVYHGKRVLNLYAAPYAIIRGASGIRAEESARPRLVVASLPDEKLLMLMMNGELVFIRTIPSSSQILTPDDIQNINMTIDYSFQTLRIRTSEVILLNIPLPPESWQQPSAPISRGTIPSLSHIPETWHESYLAPLAATVHHVEAPTLGDLAPPDYLKFLKGERIFRRTTAAMLLASIFLAGMTITERLAIAELEASVSRLRGGLAPYTGKLDGYRKLDSEIEKYSRHIQYLNMAGARTGQASSLAGLSSLNGSGCSLRLVKTESSDNFIKVHIEGGIKSEGYEDAQKIYEESAALLSADPRLLRALRLC